MLKRIIDLSRTALSQLTAAKVPPSVRTREESAAAVRELAERVAGFEREAANAHNVAGAEKEKADAALRAGNDEEARRHIAAMTQALRSAWADEARAERCRRAMGAFGARWHMLAARLDDLEHQQERSDEAEVPWGGRSVPWCHRHLVKEIDALKLQAATAAAETRRAARSAESHRAEAEKFETWLEKTKANPLASEASTLIADLAERAQRHRAALAAAEREAEELRIVELQQRARLKERWAHLDGRMRGLDE